MEHINEEQFWNYIIGDESAKNIENIEDHLSNCEQCQLAYNFNLKIHTELFEQPESGPSLGFSDKVTRTLQKYQKVEQASKFWLRFAKYTIITAMVLAIFVPLTLILVQKIELPEAYHVTNRTVLVIFSLCILPWLFYALDRWLRASHEPDTRHV